MNGYLREITGRRLHGQGLPHLGGHHARRPRAARARSGPPPAGRARNTSSQAVDAVSQLLNNTRSVCRKCYIHPTVIDAYLDGGLEKALHGRAARINGLSSFESSVVRMLRHRARHESRRAA